MAQRTRQQSILLISQEKFLSGRGSGFSNMDSDGNTGSHSSAGQSRVPALFLPWENQSNLPSDDTLKESLPKWKDELEPVENPSGLPMETATELPMSSDGIKEVPLSLWKTLSRLIK